MTSPRPFAGPAHAAPEWRLEHARTDDGWDLALYRYPGKEQDLPSVILCGGYACNRHFFDFDDRYSLARFLSGKGFDTWALELRGRGGSLAATASARVAWTFDDLARYDVPAAIRHVAERSGRAPVWIGHSMGGMVGYAAIGRDPPLGDTLAGLVTLASPVAFAQTTSWLASAIGEALLSVSSPLVPQRTALIGLWSLARSAPRALAVGMNPANTDRDAFGRALRRFMCNVPKSKLRQMVRWSTTGTFGSCDGAIDYRERLADVRTPALVVAGAADRLASPGGVRLGFDRLGSRSKTYREFGSAQGDSADYGHVDLVFGRKAPDEVFPVIAGWIRDSAIGGA